MNKNKNLYMEDVIYGAIYILFCILVSALGWNKNIGFMFSFLLSLFLSPLVGLIVTLTSQHKSIPPQKSKVKKWIGLTLVIMGTAVAINLFMVSKSYVHYQYQDEVNVSQFFVAFGVITLGAYLNNISDFKRRF